MGKKSKKRKRFEKSLKLWTQLLTSLAAIITAIALLLQALK